MELLIKIPDLVYEEVMAHYREHPEEVKSADYFERLTLNGRPLPKEHGDLIDKNKLVFNCMSDSYCDHKNCNTCQYNCVAKYEIENAIVLEGSDSE